VRFIPWRGCSRVSCRNFSAILRGPWTRDLRRVVASEVRQAKAPASWSGRRMDAFVGCPGLVPTHQGAADRLRSDSRTVLAGGAGAKLRSQGFGVDTKGAVQADGQAVVDLEYSE
jgi:hypothetical protein